MARMCPVTAVSVSSAIQSPKCHHHLNLDTKFLIPCRIHHNPPVNTLKFMPPITCKISTDQHKKDAQPASATPESKNWQRCLAAALATIVIGTGMNAEADLNKYEAETRGEFGIGSAAQFGSAELRKTVHANENFSCTRMDLQLSRQRLSKQLLKVQSSEVQPIKLTTFVLHFHPPWGIVIR